MAVVIAVNNGFQANFQQTVQGAAHAMIGPFEWYLEASSQSVKSLIFQHLSLRLRLSAGVI